MYVASASEALCCISHAKTHLVVCAYLIVIWCVSVSLLVVKASITTRIRQTEKNGWTTAITRLSAILIARKGYLHLN